MTYARVADELHPAAPQVVEVAAAGRVSNDAPEWLQVLADVLGRPVTHVTRRRATQRGTALLALDVLAPDVPRAPRTTGATYEPQPAYADHYAQRRASFAEVYDALLRG
jgi:gluconokinase